MLAIVNKRESAMKKTLRTFAVILTFLFIMNSLITNTYAESVTVASVKLGTDKEFRAVWVATVYNLDFPSKKTLTVEQMKSEIDYILDESVKMGFNAVVFQVRPCADALYKSVIFPWSEYLTGTQGTAPAGGFDPLAYWVGESHKRGLELHAWVNPYRVSHPSAKLTDTSTLPASSPAKKNPSWVVPYKDGGLYFDPGLPETKKLIVDGISEIINNYDVDGIHLDDYFYPGKDFPDDLSYAKYGQGQNRDDWRRENVNDVIKSIQKLIKEKKPSVQFGISPFAIWQNKTSSPFGSDTKGNESYKAHFADTRRWVKEGWIDYICPQIYWYIGYEIADYKKVLAWWEDVCSGTNLKLYVGHAAYKQSSGDKNWTNEIVRQLKVNETSELVKGSVFFRFGLITGDVKNQIAEYYANKTTLPKYSVKTYLKMNKLAVSVPAANVSVKASAKGYNIMGTCVPDKDLFVNGTPVTLRTSEGFFSYYTELQPGENKFVFTQPGQESVTRVVTKAIPATPAPSTPPAPQPSAPTQTPAPYVIELSSSSAKYATIKLASAWSFSGPTSDNGSAWQLMYGQKDLVTAITRDNAWVRLSSGQWIDTDSVTLSDETKRINNKLVDIKYDISGNYDLISWGTEAYPATRAFLEGNKLSVYFGMTTAAQLPVIKLPEKSMFSSATINTLEGAPGYTFVLKDSASVEGFSIDYWNGRIFFNVMQKRALAQGDKPLAGFTIVIDGGHGGSDSGAIGAMGLGLAEKDLNLINSRNVSAELEKLGATVVRVRNSDTFYTLKERTEISRKVKPNLFVSLHCNSVDTTVNGNNASGLTVWYRNENSKKFAGKLMDYLHGINPNTNRVKASNQSNYYVCRPVWTPSVIIETSFLCNIKDFSWLSNPDNQELLAKKIAEAVVEYYK